MQYMQKEMGGAKTPLYVQWQNGMKDRFLISISTFLELYRIIFLPKLSHLYKGQMKKQVYLRRNVKKGYAKCASF